MIIFNETILFTLSLLSYIVASFFYIAFFFKKRDSLRKVAYIIALLGIIFHTVGLGIRWLHSGHPPFSNIYEMLLCFVWGVVLINLIGEKRYLFRASGAFMMPLAAITMILAALFPSKEAVPLMPALQSFWLYIHVATGIISYSAFAIAFVISILYLAKMRISRASFGLWITAVAASLFPFIDSSSVLTKATYHMPRIIIQAEEGMSKIYRADKLWNIFMQQGYTQEELKFLLPFKVKMPFVGWLFLGCFILFLAACCLYIYSHFAENKKAASLAYNLCKTGFLLQLAALILLSFLIYIIPDVKLLSYPAEYIILVLTTLMVGIFLVFNFQYERILELLPGPDVLDKLSYRMIAIGFPFLTFLIITGAVWAQNAWGSYWSNDPKEWWAAITWLVYSAYLHTRVIKGWRGKPSAFFSLLGFIAVMFTFLGVTYLLPGLHGYK